MDQLPPPVQLRAFITIGSTKFDSLINHALKLETLNTFYEAGITDLIIQAGNSDLPVGWAPVGTDLIERAINGLHVELWRFKPTILDEIIAADLIICHAGSGTLLDTLRRNKKVIAIPNETLLDNHQAELADALGAQHYLLTTTVEGLEDAVGRWKAFKPEPFPTLNPNAFRSLMDDVMGFTS